MMEIRGRICTVHSRPECIAASLSPDNLQNMHTRAGKGCVITDVEGTSLRSLIASVDDYLMNLAIAEELCSLAGERNRREDAPRG
ncbi:MAG: KEOPS complex subunit Pcc1 [Methanolinea sp.]|nr:KEOPS complex subunit Pcc1 [Methanolinea sp.]